MLAREGNWAVSVAWVWVWVWRSLGAGLLAWSTEGAATCCIAWDPRTCICCTPCCGCLPAALEPPPRPTGPATTGPPCTSPECISLEVLPFSITLRPPGSA